MIRWWSEWVGSLDGRPTMYVTPLLARFGCRVDLHKFVGVDDPGCFHTHPAWAIRVILRGGYVEEVHNRFYDGWPPGRIGIIRPTFCHRVSHLRASGEPCYSLWIRGPKVAKIQLRGDGWPAHLRPVMGAEVVS